MSGGMKDAIKKKIKHVGGCALTVSNAVCRLLRWGLRVGP